MAGSVFYNIRNAGEIGRFDYDATYSRQFGRWGNDE